MVLSVSVENFKNKDNKTVPPAQKRKPIFVPAASHYPRSGAFSDPSCHIRSRHPSVACAGNLWTCEFSGSLLISGFIHFYKTGRGTF